jgi:hypothetical protein
VTPLQIGFREPSYGNRALCGGVLQYPKFGSGWILWHWKGLVSDAPVALNSLNVSQNVGSSSDSTSAGNCIIFLSITLK